MMKSIKQHVLSFILFAKEALAAPMPCSDSRTYAKTPIKDDEPMVHRPDEETYTEVVEPDLAIAGEEEPAKVVERSVHMLDEEARTEDGGAAWYVSGEREKAVVWEQIFTRELVTELMDKAERFACSVEMATFLAIMSTGGVQRLLAFAQEWDDATRVAAHAVHAALIQHCEDDLERVLKLYALWAEFGQTRGPIWAKDLFIRTDVLEQEIKPTREKLLLERSVNKRYKDERRPLNFVLLDRVRLVIAHHLFARPLPVVLEQVVHVPPAWHDWLQQGTHSDIALAYFLARQAHKVIRQTTEQQAATSPELEAVVVEVATPVDDGGTAEENVPVEDEGARQGEEDKGYEEAGEYEDYEEDREDEEYWDDEGYEGYEDDEAGIRSGRLATVSLAPDLERLQYYQPGDRVWGVVTGFIEAGIFIAIEPGVSGFVPKSKLWGRADDLGEVVAVNEEVEVIVVRINEERNNLELSMQLPENDPLRNYEEGDKVTGKVTEVNDFGAMVEVEPHVYGGIHISKMWGPLDDVRDVLNFGDTVQAYILSIDTQKHRLELSILLPENDPLRTYKPGDVVRGKVKEVRDFGVFVTIKPAVTGLVHKKDMVKGLQGVRQALKVGDEIEALVIRVEWDKRRLSLSTSEM